MRQRILAGIMLSLTVTAQASVVEYAFTGTVTSADGIYSGAPVGAIVVGTYRFNLDAAIPGQGDGVAGSYTASWRLLSLGGSWFVNYPAPPSALVFSTSAQVLGTSIAYDTGSINDFQSVASLYGYGYTYPEQGSSLFASERTATDARNSIGSGLSLGDTMIKTYGPDGLPYPVGSTPTLTVHSGYFETTVDSSLSMLNFDIKSLMPVPIPAAVWLLTSALAALGVMRRRIAS